MLYLIVNIGDGTVRVLTQDEMDASREHSESLGMPPGWKSGVFKVYKVNGEDVTQLFTDPD